MPIRIALHHRTSYRYDRAIQLGAQVIRLRPAMHTRTPVVRYDLRISPAEHFLNWQQDPYGNFLARMVGPKVTDHLTVEVELVADLVVFNPFDFFLEQGFEYFPFTYSEEQRQQLSPYLETENWGKRFAAMNAKIDRRKRGLVDYLVDLNRQVQEATDYTIRMEPGVQSPEQTLVKGSGSCRDSAWLLVHLLRHQGLAARFVSGYLVQLVADRGAVDGPDGLAEDFTDLHAWCEVYLPGAGWIGLDPTSGLLAGEGHIPLACSPQPSEAAPISGSLEECDVSFEHHMRVERLRDVGRPGRPYSEEQWQRLLACGDMVDERLEKGDVRLTMGGEPTFVSTQNPDHGEWNTDALGPTKAGLGDDLLRFMAENWAHGGMLHHGQGKWYPGEPLPRWAWYCYFRKDGQPLWKDPSLFAPPGAPWIRAWMRQIS